MKMIVWSCKDTGLADWYVLRGK